MSPTYFRGSVPVAFLAVLALAFLAGCSTVIQVPLPVDGDPGSGPALALVDIEDARDFRPFAASSPWTPSLRGSEGEADRSHVIGMMRNSFGRPLRNVYLAEGQTVESLVGDALVSGFRRAGYRTLREGDPGYADAIPVTARIERFWVWMRPGFTAVSLEFESHVRLEGEVDPFRAGDTTCGYIELHTQAAGNRQIRNTVLRGLGDFVDNLTLRVQRARSSAVNDAAFVDERCLEAEALLP